MCAMQCTTLIETCSQCTNSSIFNLNLPSKLAGMQVLQNGRRFGSTRDPQNFQKFCFVFYNISKPICNVSHLSLSLFSVNRLVNGEKVCFQPIVFCRLFQKFFGKGKISIKGIALFEYCESVPSLAGMSSQLQPYSTLTFSIVRSS